MAEEESVKVCFLGATSVGKTSIILKKLGQFSDPANTIAPSLAFIQTEEKKLMIVDTAGQERFRSLARTYYRDTPIAILVYSVCDRSSFDELGYFYNNLKEESPNSKIFVVGNKSDLPNHQISDEEGSNYAKSIEANFIITSAKSGNGIDDLFDQVSNFAKRLNTVLTSDVKLKEDDNNDDNNNKKCC